MYRFANASETASVGAEGVREVLEAYFGVLLEVFDAYGGDVLRIAGDAMIVLFHGTEGSAEMALNALRCAYSCFEHFDHVAKRSDDGLGLHVSIASGTLNVYHVRHSVLDFYTYSDVRKSLYSEPILLSFIAVF